MSGHESIQARVDRRTFMTSGTDRLSSAHGALACSRDPLDTESLMAAAKSKGKKSTKTTKGTWGGRRPGAGRPKGSGKGPSPDSRRNRVAVMLTDTELATLRGVAKKAGVPVSTAAYQFIARSLTRRRG